MLRDPGWITRGQRLISGKVLWSMMTESLCDSRIVYKGGQDTLKWHAQVGPVPSLAAWLAACASLAVL